MGLDWNPLGKPKPGFETECDTLLGQITRPEAWRQPSPVPHTDVPAGQDKASLLKRLFEIQVSPYETLAAPRVGRDPAADAWIRTKYDTAPEKPPTVEAWVERFQGYHVMALIPDNDGLPVYSNSPFNGGPERWSFRAQFLQDCQEPLGEELYHEAWLNHSPAQLADYGVRLRACASVFAAEHGVSHVLDQRWFDPADAQVAEEGGPLHQAHVIASAARWAAYWSSHGHGVHADY